MPLPPNPRPGFEVEWPPVRPKVLAYCTHKLRDHHLAEDVTERVAIRASKHYVAFLGKATFLNWGLGIARREVNRAIRRRQRRAARETPLEPGQLDSIPDESCPPPSAEDLPELPSPGQLLEEAAGADWVPPIEIKVVRLHLLESKLTWMQIGAQLGLSAMAAKLHRRRALFKLRVLMFLHLRSSLAGAELIAEAFGKAKKNTADAMVMTATEIEVFVAVVSRQDKSHQLAGSKEALVSACHKVSRCLPHGLDGMLLSAIAHEEKENELF